VAVTLLGFILVYGVLGAAGFYLMFQKAKKGPDLDDDETDAGVPQPA
jgi:cytochrome bd-type quinol oxidase subunit 1